MAFEEPTPDLDNEDPTEEITVDIDQHKPKYKIPLESVHGQFKEYIELQKKEALREIFKLCTIQNITAVLGRDFDIKLDLKKSERPLHTWLFIQRIKPRNFTTHNSDDLENLRNKMYEYIELYMNYSSILTNVISKGSSFKIGKRELYGINEKDYNAMRDNIPEFIYNRLISMMPDLSFSGTNVNSIIQAFSRKIETRGLRINEFNNRAMRDYVQADDFLSQYNLIVKHRYQETMYLNILAVIDILFPT